MLPALLCQSQESVRIDFGEKGALIGKYYHDHFEA